MARTRSAGAGTGRAWRRYLLVLGALVVVGVGVGALLVATSDASNARLTRANGLVPATEAPSVLLPQEKLAALWSQRGLIPAGDTVSTDGVVLTADQHSISARNPGTGTVRWTYRRDNTTLCSWIVLPTAAVAVYHDGTDCRDISGFDPSTGARKWFLNADLGPLTFTVAAPSIFLLADKNTVRAFYEETGGEAWHWNQSGCTIDDVGAGDVGAVILYSCTSGESSTLVLDSWTGKKSWTTDTPGTDTHVFGTSNGLVLLTTIDGRAAAVIYDANGKVRATLKDKRLHNVLSAASPRAEAVDTTQVGYDGSSVVGIDLTGLRVAYAVPATGPPSVNGYEVLIPSAHGCTLRSAVTGDLVVGGRSSGLSGAGAKVVSRVGRRVVVATAFRTTVFAG